MRRVGIRRRGHAAIDHEQHARAGQRQNRQRRQDLQESEPRRPAVPAAADGCTDCSFCYPCLVANSAGAGSLEERDFLLSLGGHQRRIPYDQLDDGVQPIDDHGVRLLALVEKDDLAAVRPARVVRSGTSIFRRSCSRRRRTRRTRAGSCSRTAPCVMISSSSTSDRSEEVISRSR